MTGATVVLSLLDPTLQQKYPYLTFFPALVFVIWRGTTGSSLFAAILGFVLASWCFAIPGSRITALGSADIIGMTGCFILALVMVGLGHVERVKERRASQRADEILRSQEALRESEEKIRTMAENARAAFGVLQGTHIIYANPAFSKMTGYSVEEMLHMEVTEMIHSEFRQLMMERARLRQAGLPVPDHYDFRMLTKSGEARWVDFSPVLAQIGGKPAIVGTGFDVTERRQAEEALRESETTLKSFYDNSSLLMGIVEVLPDNSDVIQVFDNPATCRFFGYEKNATAGRRASELGVEPDTLKWWIDRCREAERTREPVSFEYHNVKRGEPVWLSVTVSYLGTGPSGGSRIAYVAQDITDKKRADEALRLEGERLDIAQRAGRIGTFDWLIPEGKVIWSRQAEELYGLPPGGLGGTEEDWEKMIHAEDRDWVNLETKRAVNEKRDNNLEFRIVWPDGSIHWILGMGHTIFNDAGEPVRMIGVNMDITDHKRAEEALRDADRRKDEFLAMLAHELRNPMAAISAAATILSRQGSSYDKVEFAKHALKDRIKQLAHLIDDLLDVSRITRGKIELHKENVDLEGVIARAVESTREFFDERNQQLTVRVVDPLPVFGDPVRLEQIIANLLTNASRYSDVGQEATLTAFREGQEAVIRVRDEGIGISAVLLPKIFEPFTQAENSLARTRGGLGIGLTIVRNLCEMHEGGVSVQSDGEGKGSEFEVRLPIGEAYTQKVFEKMEVAGKGTLRILLVEDNADTALMGATTLESEGDTVEIAGDGPSGVQKALTMKPDVILLDIGLPGFSGYEVAERVRRAGLTDTLIIAVTGYGQEQDILKAQESGIDHHLLKPIEYEKLGILLSRCKEKRGEAKHYDA